MNTFSEFKSPITCSSFQGGGGLKGSEGPAGPPGPAVGFLLLFLFVLFFY